MSHVFDSPVQTATVWIGHDKSDLPSPYFRVIVDNCAAGRYVEEVLENNSPYSLSPPI
jgi:hypothetical protein